jgi:tRNA(Ile)-lysidine synthase
MSNRPVAFTAERLLHTLQSLPDVDSYLVGFSGGLDSTALLHALKRIEDQLAKPLSAVHINHGLHADANQWQSHCESFCQKHGIALTCLQVELKKNTGKGLEAEARQLRYQAIKALLPTGSCLLTAHHADDQAETLLLNLMRGSGVDGLSAMPVSRSRGDALLQRPLLGFQNSSLKDYLLENNIDWIEDPSNLQLDYDRNFIRHEVIPLLEQHWPEVSKRLLLTSRAMSDTRTLLEQLADNYLEEYLAQPLVLHIPTIADTGPELFKLVIRRWLKQTGASSIPVYQLESFSQQVREADSDHKVSVTWDGWVMRLFRQQLWLQAEGEILPCPSIQWPAGSSRINLGSDVGGLQFEGNLCLPPDGDFSICSRSELETATIEQGGQHKRLKNLFQQANIPPWLRDSIPLCKLNGTLIAMGDWCFSQSMAAWTSETGTRIVWRPKNALLRYVHNQQHTGQP